MALTTSKSSKSKSKIFTALKHSLRRLCFYTCLSVILFTEVCIQEGRGSAMRWVYIWGLHRGGLCIQGCVHSGMGVCIQGVCFQGGLHPKGSASKGVCIQRGLHLGGSASRGLGVCIQGGLGRPPIRYFRIQSTSRQYASYWNAFLF